tara:strand:+ start:673 stop:1695 length:1023 start_codon:yes stop_codon:yes gene_type:complete
MNPKKILLLSVIVAFLNGCAAALVPYTSDPNQKLKNSYALLSTGRAIPAEKFAKEALETFKSENNFKGMAEAHVFLGQFYQSPTYRRYAKFYKNHDSYDSTNGKSIHHSQLAVDIYSQIKNHTQKAKAISVLATAYITENRVKTCALFDQSIDAYEIGKVETPLESFEYNNYYESFNGLIEAFKEEYCSSEAIALFDKPKKKVAFDLTGYSWQQRLSVDLSLSPGLDTKGCMIKEMFNKQLELVADELGVDIVQKHESTPHLSLVLTKFREGMFATAKTKTWVSADLYQNEKLIGNYDSEENIDFYEGYKLACDRIEVAIGHTLMPIFSWLKEPRSLPRP